MFVITIPFFNLDTIYDSGQVFTWYKVGNCSYIIPYNGKCVKVQQKKESVMFSCTEEEFYKIWYNYFDLKVPYNDINYLYRDINSYTKAACVRGKGIRILKQNPFEIMICAILETGISVESTRQMVRNICMKCGIKHKNSFGNSGSVTWYEFPTAQQILDKKDKLTTQDVGCKKDVIIDICKNYIDNWIDFDYILQYNLKLQDVINYLSDFNGIGIKTANMIALFGLNYYNAFPIDTHIRNVLTNIYEMNYEEFCEWYINDEDKKNYLGYLRQIYFYNDKFPPKGYIELEKNKRIYRKVGKRNAR